MNKKKKLPPSPKDQGSSMKDRCGVTYLLALGQPPELVRQTPPTPPTFLWPQLGSRTKLQLVDETCWKNIRKLYSFFFMEN